METTCLIDMLRIFVAKLTMMNFPFSFNLISMETGIYSNAKELSIFKASTLLY